ncbi:TPA: hypothetical protein N0F65_008407, partial [Lagenidium giganteum]
TFDDDWDDDDRGEVSNFGSLTPLAIGEPLVQQGRQPTDAFMKKNSKLLGPISYKAGNPGRQKNDAQPLKNVKSLPELETLSKKTSASPAALATSAMLSPTSSPAFHKKSSAPFNAADVVKRIQTLGTSSSTPTISSVSGGPLSGNIGPATLSAAAAASAAALTDAEKLQNDFNSQHSRLYYGCSVAFELFNGHLMMVGYPEGRVVVQSLEKMKAPQVKGSRDRAVFTLIDLGDTRSANSIRFGDAVWLQISGGTGEVTWEQGGVLGAKVREAPQLKTLALSEEGLMRNDVQAPAIVGQPVPVKAYLPKSRDDGDAQVDEIQSKVRNKTAKSLGKWIVRSAVMQKRKQKDDFVYNNDEIYLEQDWFYLGADSDAGVAVLRQLPPASAMKDTKKGEYVIERRAAWRIRLLDSSNGSTGMTLAQQQMERLLFKAKSQLKQSKKMRAGQTKTYGPNLHGGTNFVSQLRTQLVMSTKQCEGRYMNRQEKRLDRLGNHMIVKADAMNRIIVEEGMELPTDFAAAAESDRSWTSSHSISPRQRQAKGQDSTSQSHHHHPNHHIHHPVDQSEPKEDVCSLCQSSTIAYNLCCQIHTVMHTLDAEHLAEKSMQAKMNNHRTTKNHHHHGHHSAHHSANSTNSHEHSGSSGDSGAARASIVTDSDHLVAAKKKMTHESPRNDKERERIMRLFSNQDQQMIDIIKFKEKEAEALKLAQEQARVGLSPVATHFRDRFKHVGLLAQYHLNNTEQHGIGRHFQHVHSQLRKESRLAIGPAPVRRASQLFEDGMVFDMRTCPFNYPPEGFDVFGNPVEDPEDLIPKNRLFPTAEELEQVPPIDTKQIMELYLQNRHAVTEMLSGFMELVETQMRPNLELAMETRNRSSMVEFLDFTARAAEFVCAYRVQVAVARLLHQVASSEVGDFDFFRDSYIDLMREFDGTSAFIRFYRDKSTRKLRKRC